MKPKKTPCPWLAPRDGEFRRCGATEVWWYESKSDEGWMCAEHLKRGGHLKWVSEEDRKEIANMALDAVGALTIAAAASPPWAMQATSVIGSCVHPLVAGVTCIECSNLAKAACWLVCPCGYGHLSGCSKNVPLPASSIFFPPLP